MSFLIIWYLNNLIRPDLADPQCATLDLGKGFSTNLHRPKVTEISDHARLKKGPGKNVCPLRAVVVVQLVGRAVATDTRGQRFESSHARNFIHYQLY